MTFPHTIEILPRTLTTSAMGGTSYTYAASGQFYRAFVQYRSETMQIINETGGVQTGVVIYTQATATAQNYDRIRFENRLYEIVGVMPMHGQRGLHHLKINVVELSQQ